MLHRYPQEAALRDGRPVIIRPFQGGDVEALYDFFQRLPATVRRLAWDRIDDRRLIESWGDNVDYEKTLPLLAFHGNDVVADATLHRRQGGPLRLVGRIKWLLDPDYRGAGLGSLLVNHFIDHATANGLHHLTCMLIEETESDAIQTLEDLGFQSYRIPGYGVDPDGNRHDMVKLVMELNKGNGESNS